MLVPTIIYVCILTFVSAADKEQKSAYYSEEYYNYYDEEYDDMQLNSTETVKDSQVEGDTGTDTTVEPPTILIADAKVDDSTDTDNTVEPPTILIADAKDTEFRGRVSCSTTQMTLEIDKTLLPAGLGFRDSISEDLVTKGNSEPIPCIRIIHNKTHYIYNVSLDCQRAVGKLDFVESTIYTHEFILNDIRTKKSKRESIQAYSVIIDCETPLSKSTPQKWFPQYRIFEHRQGSDCSVETCPHEDLCLPSENIKGYFCSCPQLEKSCVCPDDFYGCSFGDGISTSESVICVRNEQLCDTRYDCPLQDDENCGDVWKDWGPWSQCSASCGEGTQMRQRSCAYVFKQDPSRHSKECSNSTSTEQDVRSCNSKSCSSVECGSQEMTIEIPLEFGMTQESVKERMHLTKVEDEEGCEPVVNSTHVRFTIPLHKCGTTNWVDGDIIFYSNEVEYGLQDQESSIIVRELGHSYTAKCQYKRRQTVSMQRLGADTSFHEVASLKFEEITAGRNGEALRLDVITHYSSGDGEFEYRMDIFEDSSYTTSYKNEDYPLEKKLGERLFIGVNFKSQDEDLHVFIERCWATSSDENKASYDDAMYLFINGGCPTDNTVQFHNDDDSPFSDRYSIETFKFNDAQFWYIYFRCDVILCDASENDPACQRNCVGESEGRSTFKRRKRAANYKEHTYRQVMQGPIVVLNENDVIDPQQRWRSKTSVGSVEHKIITKEEGTRIRFIDQQPRDKKNVWESPYIAAGIVGSICLAIGIVLGVILRKKSTPTTSKEVHL
ncbi:uncharacterized protein LOC120346120 [Styela clava]